MITSLGSSCGFPLQLGGRWQAEKERKKEVDVLEHGGKLTARASIEWECRITNECDAFVPVDGWRGEERPEMRDLEHLISSHFGITDRDTIMITSYNRSSGGVPARASVKSTTDHTHP
jgi:hypothetical protein